MNILRRFFIAAAIFMGGIVWADTDFTKFVDPMIGSAGHGHVFVGANVPFGAVQAGPTQPTRGWDWCSGYHYSDSVLLGFSQMHLSGTGIGELGDIVILPVVNPKATSDVFRHTDEKASAGYYSVKLGKSGIFAEMTATQHVAVHRYTWRDAGKPRFLRIDLRRGIGWDRHVESSIRKESSTRLSGFRRSAGWAKKQMAAFAMQFSEPIQKMDVMGDTVAILKFRPSKEPLEVKVGISAVSPENAAENIEKEIAQGDGFDRIYAHAKEAWNKELSKISVEMSDTARLRTFYTALYHTMVAPSVFSDVNGEYRDAAGEIKRSNRPVYTTLSLWDVYRAAFPLFTLIHPDRVADVASTMLDISRAQGKLPVWHLVGNETDCMVGNPAIPVLADFALKGFDVDVKGAFREAKKSMLRNERGLSLMTGYGYIPFDADSVKESVAKTLEYAIADDATSKLATLAGREKDALYFHARSREAYRHLFDKGTGFIRATDTRGNRREPFDPCEAVYETGDYTEGNAWQYTWLMPHDVYGIIDSYGSEEAFLTKLDSLFVVQGDLGSEAPPDISGLIGQYAHGNEPGHHIPYLYAYAGRQDKTAGMVRRIMRELYSDKPDGLCGNEDVGQMSAWYVLSALGLYQVDAAGGPFIIGSPEVNVGVIDMGNGKKFTITAEGNSPQNIYVVAAELNGKPYTRSYIDFQTIAEGGELKLLMGDTPSDFGRSRADRPLRADSLYPDARPEKPLFRSEAIEKVIEETCSQLKNPKLARMFANCFPNTLDTTVHFSTDSTGNPRTFVYTGDIHAMWLRDSSAQLWPYIPYAKDDEVLDNLLEGAIREQMRLICIDPYANAFNAGPTGGEWQSDYTKMDPNVHERKWEVDSPCYAIRFAYEYWQQTGNTAPFDETWIAAMEKILDVFTDQQRKTGNGNYRFQRRTERASDSMINSGYGAPVNPVGLIASAFRPSDDATTFLFLIPSNFFAVSSLRKAAHILRDVSGREDLARRCDSLADEVEKALRDYATYKHPEFGEIYAYEVDGFGNHLLMDDANVPSLIAMPYLGDVDINDPVYQNTQRFVWSKSNPYFFSGMAGEGIGGPHIGPRYAWPMSLMMKAFTTDDDNEIRECLRQLLNTDAGTGFIHESFNVDYPADFTRAWFAWQNTLFGELILDLIKRGKLGVLNSL